MNLLTCICILVLPSSCLLVADDEFEFPKDRTTSPSTRIIGGEEVTPHSYPFVVGLILYRPPSDPFFCGGTLIYPKWVLTAAHCLDFKPDYIQVVLGSHNLSVTETSRIVIESRSYVIHKGWNNSTLRNDIGLIKLSTDVTLNSYINTVNYATSTQTYAKQNGTTVGWGKTSDATNNISYVLRKVTSTILSNQECAAQGPYSQVLISSHMCVSGKGPVGSCNGDSGGPLLVGNVQVGIVSFGYKYCSYGYPSVYTRLSDFEDWIEQHVKGGGQTLSYSVAVVTLAVLINFFKQFVNRDDVQNHVIW